MVFAADSFEIMSSVQNRCHPNSNKVENPSKEEDEELVPTRGGRVVFGWRVV